MQYIEVTKGYLGRDGPAVLQVGVEQALRVSVQVVHGKVDTGSLAPRNGQVARLCGASGQHNRVRARVHVLDIDVLADVGICTELDTFLSLSENRPIIGEIGKAARIFRQLSRFMANDQ